MQKISLPLKGEGSVYKGSKWIWKRFGYFGFVAGKLIAPWIVYDHWIIDWVWGVTYKDRIFGVMRFKKLGG